jgi:hypothetical protein
MIKDLTPEIHEVLEAFHYRPAVSIIMPFEPKMSKKRELIHSLELVTDKVERELTENYRSEMSALVVQRLRAIIKSLDFNTYKKSIAIYVSPVFEKVLYLDIPVEEKIMVGESFEIRDLLYSKKQLHEYLVLLLSGKEYRMYFVNSGSFVKIVANKPESVYAYINEIPQRVANFSDISKRKEIVMDKFLHHIDSTLEIILNAYHLPLFVLGPEKMVGHFKKLTQHATAVIEYVHGNYEKATVEQLREILEVRVADWNKVIQKDLLNKIEEAAGRKKLAVGMRDVWREAMNHNGSLLVLEKDNNYTGEGGYNNNAIDKGVRPYSRFSYIKDVVGDLIEKVLESGGDVEFVDRDIMKNLHRIALVKYH